MGCGRFVRTRRWDWSPKNGAKIQIVRRFATTGSILEWVLLNSSRKNFRQLKNGTTRLQKYTFFQNRIHNRSARRRQKLWALSSNLVFNVARHRKSVTRRQLTNRNAAAKSL